MEDVVQLKAGLAKGNDRTRISCTTSRLKGNTSFFSQHGTRALAIILVVVGIQTMTTRHAAAHVVRNDLPGVRWYVVPATILPSTQQLQVVLSEARKENQSKVQWRDLGTASNRMDVDSHNYLLC